MGLVLALILLCAGSGGEPQGAGADWSATWARLAEVRRLPADDPARGPALEALRAQLPDPPREPRAALLAAHLERLRGGTTPLVLGLDPRTAWPFAGEENWLVAEVHAPSAVRAQAARRALQELPGAVGDERLLLAWQIGVEEARALRLESARGLQSVLHERYQAVWSAMDLSLTLSRLGEAERADAVLAAQIEREAAAGRPTGDLWARRGTQALGNGDEARARDYLGHGLARGSADAGIVLARLDLDQGRLTEARAGFRALLLDADPSPWAPRGWGLTLLPPPSTDRTAPAGE